MTLHRLILVSLLSIIMTAVPSVHADTVGTAFTYQGVLSDAGAPVAGDYDFRVFLYNADAGGGQVGTTVLVGNAAVTDGRVSLDLDFGDVFDGTALWLEIHLRETGTTTYTPLWPRQRLTATPFANHAAEANTATSALWADDAGSAVSAADADQLGGQSPAYYLAWSNITGVPGDLSNGDDDTLADLSCAAGEIAKWSGSIWACGDDVGGRSSTYIVGPVGTTTDNGTALLAAVASLPTATETAQILVQVEPGAYDLGTNSLALPDWVSLEGAGRIQTKVTSATCGGSATVQVDSHSELRSLTVVNTCSNPAEASLAVNTDYLSAVFDITAISEGNGSDNRALINVGNEVVIERASLEVLNGTGGTRIALESTSPDLALLDVDAVVSGGSAGLYAIKSSGGGTLIAENVTASATESSGGAYGLYTSATVIQLTNVEATAQTTTFSAHGVYTSTVSERAVTMLNVRASASGEAGWASHGILLTNIHSPSVIDQVTALCNYYGISVSDGDGLLTILHSHLTGSASGLNLSVLSEETVTIHHSNLIGTTKGLTNYGLGSVTVASTQITNGTSGAFITCAGVWDENYTFYPDSCP